MPFLAVVQDGKTVPIAIKVLKDTKAEAKRTLLQEAALMGQFNHSNVVRLLGVVTAGEPVRIVEYQITEFCIAKIGYQWCGIFCGNVQYWSKDHKAT